MDSLLWHEEELTQHKYKCLDKTQFIKWSEKVSYTIMAGHYMYEEELEEKKTGRGPDSRRSM